MTKLQWSSLGAEPDSRTPEEDINSGLGNLSVVTYDVSQCPSSDGPQLSSGEGTCLANMGKEKPVTILGRLELFDLETVESWTGYGISDWPFSQASNKQVNVIGISIQGAQNPPAPG